MSLALTLDPSMANVEEHLSTPMKAFQVARNRVEVQTLLEEDPLLQRELSYIVQP